MVSNISYFHPDLGKIPILATIFQRGWNYQPDTFLSKHWFFLPNLSKKISSRQQVETTIFTKFCKIKSNNEFGDFKVFHGRGSSAE